MSRFRRTIERLAVVVFVVALTSSSARAAGAPQFSIVLPASRGDQPLDGRLLLLLSTDPSAEPRMQINDSVRSQMVFGMDVEGLRSGRPVTFDQEGPGYPVRRLSDVPTGD